MRTRLVGVAAGMFVAASAAAVAGPARLAPPDIQKNFFNGEPFTAATPSGVKFKMVFTADGKTSREPAGKGGVRGAGAWTLNADGFCTAWGKNGKPNCYTLISSGSNKWSVMNKNTVMATWSK